MENNSNTSNLVRANAIQGNQAANQGPGAATNNQNQGLEPSVISRNSDTSQASTDSEISRSLNNSQASEASTLIDTPNQSQATNANSQNISLTPSIVSSTSNSFVPTAHLIDQTPTSVSSLIPFSITSATNGNLSPTPSIPSSTSNSFVPTAHLDDQPPSTSVSSPIALPTTVLSRSGRSQSGG